MRKVHYTKFKTWLYHHDSKEVITKHFFEHQSNTVVRVWFWRRKGEALYSRKISLFQLLPLDIPFLYFLKMEKTLSSFFRMWNIIWGHIYPSVETIWIYWPPTKTWPTYCLPLCDEKAQEGFTTETVFSSLSAPEENGEISWPKSTKLRKIFLAMFFSIWTFKYTGNSFRFQDGAGNQRTVLFQNWDLNLKGNSGPCRPPTYKHVPQAAH